MPPGCRSSHGEPGSFVTGCARCKASEWELLGKSGNQNAYLPGRAISGLGHAGSDKGRPVLPHGREKRQVVGARVGGRGEERVELSTVVGAHMRVIIAVHRLRLAGKVYNTITLSSNPPYSLKTIRPALPLRRAASDHPRGADVSCLAVHLLPLQAEGVVIRREGVQLQRARVRALRQPRPLPLEEAVHRRLRRVRHGRVRTGVREPGRPHGALVGVRSEEDRHAREGAGGEGLDGALCEEGAVEDGREDEYRGRALCEERAAGAGERAAARGAQAGERAGAVGVGAAAVG